MPFCFILLWFVTVRFMEKPKRSWIMASFIVPCVIFFLLGGSLRSRAGHIVSNLIFSDCGAHPDVRDLELAYKNAASKYETCTKGVDHAVLFQTCPNYETWLEEGKNKKYWEYLQFLETSFSCSGFCHATSNSLWTYREVNGDSCALIVANVFRTKVSRIALMLMMYPIFVLFGFLVWNIAVRSSFQTWTQGQHHWNQERLHDFQDQLSHVKEIVEHKAHDIYDYGAARFSPRAAQRTPPPAAPPVQQAPPQSYPPPQTQSYQSMPFQPPSSRSATSGQPPPTFQPAPPPASGAPPASMAAPPPSPPLGPTSAPRVKSF